MTLPKNGKIIIVYREGCIFLYIEGLPQLHVNCVEEDIGVYSFFTEDEMPPPMETHQEDQVWHLHFDKASSNEGNGASICFTLPSWKDASICI